MIYGGNMTLSVLLVHVHSAFVKSRSANVGSVMNPGINTCWDVLWAVIDQVSLHPRASKELLFPHTTFYPFSHHARGHLHRHMQRMVNCS